MLFVAIFSSACGSRQQQYRLIAAPGDAFAMAPMGSDSLALLGGNESARNVSIERASDGTVLRLFGVTREADTVVAAPSGSIYLGLVTSAGGAVEEWSADGRQLRTIPMPAGVIGVTTAGKDGIWALIHRGKAYAAVAVPATGQRAGRVIPLPAGTSSLAYCEGLADPSFVISERDAHITLVRIRDGATTDTTNVGEDPVCSKTSRAIYALSRAGDATYLSVISQGTLLTVRTLPMMRDAALLATGSGGELIALGKGPQASAIRIYSSDATELRAGS